MVSIIPQFSGIYDQFGAELPAITQFVLQISDIVQKLWWLLLCIVLLLISLFAIMFKTNQTFQHAVHTVMLKIPVFGKLLQKALIARMTRTLASLFSSAVPILDARSEERRVGKVCSSI